jgi:hypothetical protein
MLSEDRKQELAEQVEALGRLVSLCLSHRGGGTYPIIDFLMSMYDGENYRPDMQLLSRRIDAQPFEDVLKVMRLYRATGKEPHEFFKDGGALFERLASFTAPVK